MQLLKSAAYLDANANNNFPKSSPIRKEVARIVDGAVTELKFYLADVEALLLVVIANMAANLMIIWLSKIVWNGRRILKTGWRHRTKTHI
jgi:hypothetical protein